MEGEGILSSSPCPGDEQPQACPKFLTPQTLHSEPPACASSRSQSSETAAENISEWQVTQDKDGLFSPPQLYKSTIWGELIP